jgi:methionyl-tRNA synthetase
LDAVSHQIERTEGKTFYCTHCDCYGYEGFGRGECNWCGSPSDASQCEHCARIPDINQMHHMTCMSCQQPMTETTVEQYYWRIGENYQNVAQAYADKPARECLKNYLVNALQNNEEGWAITRPGDAGLPMPALDNQPLHTWFMGLSGYHASVEEFLQAHPERGTFSDWWNTSTQLIHFLGFDCSYSHAIGYVAQQLNDPEGPPPGKFFTNRFLKLDGDDFSTSRGNAIWIRDMCTQYPSDSVRLFTALKAPETAVKNFVFDEFKTWHEDFFKALAQAIDQLPATRFSQDSGDDDWVIELQRAWDTHSNESTFSMSGMAECLCMLADRLIGSTLISSHFAWQTWAHMAQSICPNLANDIHKNLQGDFI